jgi:lipopolysaccharide heptosyltransferase I
MRKRNSTIDLSRLKPPRRVCLIKPSSLGDVVQALPVLCALKDLWPDACFTWVVNRNLSDLLAGHRCLDEIIEFDRAGRGPGRFRVVVDLARRLREGGFDLVCDLQGLLRTGLMTAATRAPVRVGLSTSREHAHLFYTHAIPVSDPDMPAVERYLLLAEQCGANTQDARFDVFIPPDDAAWAEAQLAALQRPAVVVNPGARWTTKRWPAEHFGAIAARAAREFGAGMVIVGSADERAVADVVARHVGDGCLNLAGETSLKQLAALLERADLVLTNDSGPMHLAAAVRTPVVGIFTCTSPRRAGPHGSGHRVVATAVDCAASYLKQCDRLDCMRELTPELVWPDVAEKLTQMARESARSAGVAAPHTKIARSSPVSDTR